MLLMCTALLGILQEKFGGSQQFALNRFAEHGRGQGVEFGGGLGLQALQGVHLRLQRVWSWRVNNQRFCGEDHCNIRLLRQA